MKKLSDKTIAVIALLAIIVGSGAVPVSVKIAVKELSPEYFSFLRFLLASLILSPLFLRTKVKLNRDFAILILISLLLTLNILAFAYGLKTTTATIGQLLYAISPIFIAIFSFILVRERITTPKVAGILLGILGTAVVLTIPLIGLGIHSAGDLKGNLLVIVGVISTALYTSLSQKLHVKFSPIQVAQAFFLTTAVSMLVLSFPEILRSGKEILTMDLGTILAVLYVGGIGTPIFYVLYQYAIKHGSPLIASINFFIVPFSSYSWAYLLLGERLNSYL
ncbi:MAG: DMT family transporter, partial [Patescibacteria group bacterium]